MIHDFSKADEFVSAICDLVSSMVGEPAEIVYERFMQEEFEGAAIGERMAELMAPVIDSRGSVHDYVGKTLRDGWSGYNGRKLEDSFLLAIALIESGHIKPEEVEEDDELCPSCGSDKFIRFEDGSQNCFDCIPSEAGPTKEEVQDEIDELEKQGLVEWTGEWHPARDGTMEKAYRAVEKRRLH